METNDSQRVDDLRKQLRALGYLDAGVDRFVLGSARAERSPWTIAALSSLRVGLLAAALLGPITAAGIGARLPGLVTGPRDAIVVALYLALTFGVAATLFTFLASVAVATLGGTAVASRARAISRAAGTLVAVGCLAYLTLWWRSANVDTWSSPVWTTAALLVAVIVSILVGHAVAITTFAVIAARQPALVSASTTPAASTRWLVVAAGGFAFVAAAGLLLLAAPRDTAPVEQPHLAVVSPGVRLVAFGIDGFDPEVFEPLRAAGRVPALARMFERGTLRIATDESRDPARTWTTIATGQPPDIHGVHSLETRRVAGVGGSVTSGETAGVARTLRGATDLLRLTRPAIASGGELRAKPFWEVASQAGLRVTVVNWWATWPAVGGGQTAPVILSDRATLRLERGGELDAEISPREVYDHLKPQWATIKDHAARMVADVGPMAADAALAATLRRSAELDALQLAMVIQMPAETSDQWDLFAAYFPGLDILQHTLLSTGESLSASAMSARLDAVRSYYVFLDKLLGLFLDGEHLSVLVTQPGRLKGPSHGLMAIHGRRTRHLAPSINGEVRAVDVAPTILYALGVPLSRELAGRARTELFASDFVSRFPVREVPTYGPRRPQGAVRQGQPLDEEMVERLRSLGYVR